MFYVHDYIEQVSNDLLEQLEGIPLATAEEIGLDKRSFYGKCYVGEDFIAVQKKQDRTLQYYGGFEYVEDENRVQIGNTIFYLADDCERVQDCIDRFNGKQATDDEEEEGEDE